MKALDQWTAYTDAFARAGWEVVVAEAANDSPDGVFIEDTAFVYGSEALITRPGAPSRVAETDSVEGTLRQLGLDIDRVSAPGTIDGGDLLKHNNTIWVGESERTNAEGIGQLMRFLDGKGCRVVVVPVTKSLHLKTQVSALPNGAIIGYPPLVDAPEAFSSFIAVPEPSGANVVLLGGNRVLIAADAPQSARILCERGFDVVTVDVSEFQKLDGSVTCLSLRIR